MMEIGWNDERPLFIPSANSSIPFHARNLPSQNLLSIPSHARVTNTNLQKHNATWIGRNGKAYLQYLSFSHIALLCRVFCCYSRIHLYRQFTYIDTFCWSWQNCYLSYTLEFAYIDFSYIVSWPIPTLFFIPQSMLFVYSDRLTAVAFFSLHGAYFH